MRFSTNGWRTIPCATCRGRGVTPRGSIGVTRCSACDGRGSLWHNIWSGVVSKWPGGPPLERAPRATRKDGAE